MAFYETISIHFRPVTTGPLLHLTIPAAPINVFVGPNGAGKSTVVYELARQRNDAKIACTRTLSREALREAAERNAPNTRISEAFHRQTEEIVRQGEARRRTFRCAAHSTHSEFYQDSMTQQLRKSMDALESMERIVLSVSSSLPQIATGARGRFNGNPSSRLDVLFRDPAALGRLRRHMSEMFGLYPVINAARGQLELRFSRTAPADGLERTISPENEAFMDAALTPDQLSDGIRTYVGLWGHLLSGTERLVFLDEAGAYLHPPLARQLGKQLTQLGVERRGHIFAATHSPDFMLGCVQAGCRANVVRLTYRDGASTAQLLSADDLLPLMRDPLLRSANVLSGVFHDGVVVCEADSDRAFYQEINERLLDVREGLDSCHFVNAQNWQTIPRIAAALRRLGIPTAQVVDLDAVLHDDARLLLEAAEVPDAILRGLGQIRGDLAKHVADRKQFKARGLDAVPSTLRDSWDKYLQDLGEYGIFAAPVGELEGWFPELGISRGKKADWIVDTFKHMGSDPADASYVRPGGGGPWEFIRRISRWILNPRRRGMPALPADAPAEAL